MIAIAGIVLAVAIIGFVLWMLLTRRLREKYAALWLVIALLVLVVGIFPGLWQALTMALGVQLPSNLLFAAAILLLMGVTLHLSWELSSAEDEIRRLAEESALHRSELERLDERLAHLERREAAGERPEDDPSQD
ncbi:DUF2304 domain-containing protein [Microbacterium murale]|uniref:DUF2304 domain-containing protein n=1 Tax=Microbacterium murale TaxID=1081040 RepID=A0ABU0PCI9_9MICO|nr:DUF2304 domain-containing protein [Microbacterium murale]MDQ0645048.1 hypothetical protein [Microbacterium murale]